jgi:hypothetical protein
MNIHKFGHTSFEMHKKGGHSLSSASDLSVSNAALDVQNRKVTNVASPNDPKDAANKTYVDNAIFSMRKEIQVIKYHMEGFDDHILQIFGRETNYLKMQDWDELFKEDFLEEKNKLIQCLLDLISGKISRPPLFDSTDLEKINKAELLAVLESWREK